MLGGGQAAAARPMRGRAGAVGAAGGARGAAGSSEPVSARSLPVPAPPAAARRALGGGAACTRLGARSMNSRFPPPKNTPRHAKQILVYALRGSHLGRTGGFGGGCLQAAVVSS